MKHKQNCLNYVLFIGILVLLASCNHKAEKEESTELEKQNILLNSLLQDRDSVINEMMETFSQIEKDLAFIKESRKLISVSSDPEIEESQKDRVVQDVKELGKLLQQNQKNLKDLNRRLKKSGIKVKNLETRIAELSKSLNDRNNELISLTNELEKKDYEVSVLNEQITNLVIENEAKDTVITNQIATINNFNKAYYTLGTQKELIEKGVITVKGGFLGLGKTETLNNDIKLDDFSEIDIRKTNSININAENARLVSEHPEGSYEFIAEEEAIAYLAINNVNEFYKLSKVVVLEVK